MPSGRKGHRILRPEAVQEGVSEEGQGRSVSANRYNDTAEFAADCRRAHPFHGLLSTSIRDSPEQLLKLQDRNDDVDPRASVWKRLCGLHRYSSRTRDQQAFPWPTQGVSGLPGNAGPWSGNFRNPAITAESPAVRALILVRSGTAVEPVGFTGAVQRRLGRFELAVGGTIFLDEIDELPAESRMVLLRVPQVREFERVGGTGSTQTNVRRAKFSEKS